MSDYLLPYVCEKEEVGEEVEETISDPPKRGKGELLIINGGLVYEVDATFEKVIYFSIYIYLGIVEAISVHISYKKMMK